MVDPVYHRVRSSEISGLQHVVVKHLSLEIINRGRTGIIGYLHISEAMNGKAWHPRLRSLALQCVFVGGESAAQIVQIDASVIVKELREAQLHFPATLTLDFHLEASGEVLSHVQNVGVVVKACDTCRSDNVHHLYIIVYLRAELSFRCGGHVHRQPR